MQAIQHLLSYIQRAHRSTSYKVERKSCSTYYTRRVRAIRFTQICFLRVQFSARTCTARAFTSIRSVITLRIIRFRVIPKSNRQDGGTSIPLYLVATQFACKPEMAAIVIKTELQISFLKRPFSSDLSNSKISALVPHQASHKLAHQ